MRPRVLQRMDALREQPQIPCSQSFGDDRLRFLTARNDDAGISELLRKVPLMQHVLRLVSLRIWRAWIRGDLELRDRRTTGVLIWKLCTCRDSAGNAVAESGLDCQKVRHAVVDVCLIHPCWIALVHGIAAGEDVRIRRVSKSHSIRREERSRRRV